MPGTVTRQARPGRGPLGRGLLLAGLILGCVLAALWALGLADPLQDRVTEAQRAVQNRLAGAVRAIRAGESGAVLGLMAICFGYGFLHAVGPGHGKMLIGGYGMARRVGPGRLAGIALVSSLAQAAVAVALVYGFIAVMGWTRERLEAVSETVLDPVGTLAILGIGLWLALRGLRGIARDGAGGAGGAPAGQDHSHGHAHSHDHGQHHDHDHGHDHDHAHVHSEACGCGHSHGPTPDQIAGARDTKAVLALIAGVAIRPCSGALFLLILTWKLGIATAGIMGAFAMGLGTASVTMAVAGAAVWMREGALAALPDAGVARALPVLELLVGAVVVVVAARMLWAGI